MNEYEELPPDGGEVPVTQVDYAPMLPGLPFDRMDPAAFERLCADLARHHLRLTNVTLYGRRGQRQQGIDIVGDRPHGGRTVIQCKRYPTFSASNLTAAVQTFDDGNLPWAADEFIVAVPADVNDTKIQDERIRLDDSNASRSIGLWGIDTLDEILRQHHDVVARYFGPAAAAAHSPAQPTLDSPSRPLRGDLALAATQGPVKSTGADVRLRRAEELLDGDPGSAADEVRRAQKLLTEAGFLGHARYLDSTLANALRRAGRLEEAAWILHDHLWADMGDGRISGLRQDLGIISDIAKELGSDSTIHHLAQLDEIAVSREQAPVFWAPPTLPAHVPNEALAVLGRVALLVAQDASADPESTWVSEQRDELAAIAHRLRTSGEPDRVRLADLLDIELADAAGELDGLLLRARRREFPREIAAIVCARAAWQHATAQRFDDADIEWQDAIDHLVAINRPAQAAQMVSCRFKLKAHTERLGELTSLGQLAHALRVADPDGTLRTDRDDDAAARSLVHHNLPSAAWQARRAVRRAHAVGAWADAATSRDLLVKVFHESGELRLAAIQRILSGRTADLDKIAKDAGDDFLDVAAWTTPAHPYWVRGAAFSLMAEQADLLPDAAVDAVFDTALAVLHDFVSNRLVDSRATNPVMRIEALRLLAGLAERVDDHRAERLIADLGRLVERAGSGHRNTDDEHVRALARIGERTTGTGENAMRQLIRLYEVAPYSRRRIDTSKVLDSLKRHLEAVEPDLRRMASSGLSAATETLVLLKDGHDQSPSPEVVAEAVQRLEAPSRNEHGVTTWGTSAGGDSLLAIDLPSHQRQHIIEALLAKALDDTEPSWNKSEYLGAAVNLSRELPEPDTVFQTAIVIAQSPTSPVIESELYGNHPLSSFRSDLAVEVRPEALLLAARTASAPQQRAQVRDVGIRLLSSIDGQAMPVIHAFQEVGWELFRGDLALLATHTLTVARQFAAQVWANDQDASDEVGIRLTDDPDANVRNVLARAIRAAKSPRPAFEQVLDILTRDPRHSVRALSRSEA